MRASLRVNVLRQLLLRLYLIKVVFWFGSWFRVNDFVEHVYSYEVCHVGVHFFAFKKLQGEVLVARRLVVITLQMVVINAAEANTWRTWMTQSSRNLVGTWCYVPIDFGLRLNASSLGILHNFLAADYLIASHDLVWRVLSR